MRYAFPLTSTIVLNISPVTSLTHEYGGERMKIDGHANHLDLSNAFKTIRLLATIEMTLRKPCFNITSRFNSSCIARATIAS